MCAVFDCQKWEIYSCQLHATPGVARRRLSEPVERIEQALTVSAKGMEARRAETRYAEARYVVRQPGPKGRPSADCGLASTGPSTATGIVVAPGQMAQAHKGRGQKSTAVLALRPDKSSWPVLVGTLVTTGR